MDYGPFGNLVFIWVRGQKKVVLLYAFDVSTCQNGVLGCQVIVTFRFTPRNV